jgi:hypothetical protein
MFSQVMRGGVIRKIITAADTPQRLTETKTLVKWASIVPGSVQEGNILMSYGVNDCGLPNLPLSTIEGQWVDLNNVWVKSSAIGDEVYCNYGASFP